MGQTRPIAVTRSRTTAVAIPADWTGIQPPLPQRGLGTCVRQTAPTPARACWAECVCGADLGKDCSSPMVGGLTPFLLLARPVVDDAGQRLAGPVPAGLGTHLGAAPVLRALVIDGVGVWARTAGQDALLEAWLGPDPHDDAVHVRAGEVPVVDTRDAAAPLGEVARSTRIPCITRPTGPLGIDHKVPPREGRPHERAIARLPGALPVNEAPDILVAAAATPSGGTGRQRPPVPRLARQRRPRRSTKARPPGGPVRTPSVPSRAPAATVPTARRVPVPATALPRVRITLGASRGLTSRPAPHPSEVLGVPSPGTPTALRDGALLQREAVHETPELPTAPPIRSRRAKAGVLTQTLRRALIVLTSAGLLLGAGIRGIPPRPKGAKAIERPPIPRPDARPVGRPGRGLPR